MIFTAKAQRQLDDLLEYYESKDRAEASSRFRAATREAIIRIESAPADGLPAPRSYPEMTRPGRAWIKSGRYWFSYTLDAPPTIVAVFFETADIPRRL